MNYNSLPIYFLKNVSRDKAYEFVTYCYEYTPFRTPNIILNNKNDLDKALETKEISPDKVSVLYFDSASTFPRFKLKNTQFQRCIKVEKCDCVVIPDKIEYTEGYNEYIIYKSLDAYYGVCLEFLKDKDPHLYKYVTNNGTVSLIDVLTKTGVINKDWEIVYTGKILFTDSKYVDTITNLITIYPAYIKETNLDLFLNKDYDTVTEEMLISLNGMFKSKDNSVVELGMKMLQGLNVVKTPLAIKCLLLGNYDRIHSNKAYYNTGFSQVLKSLDINRYVDSAFPGNVSKLMRKTISSELDMNLSNVILKEMIRNELERFGNKIIEYFPQIPLTITTYVE